MAAPGVLFGGVLAGRGGDHNDTWTWGRSRARGSGSGRPPRLGSGPWEWDVKRLAASLEVAGRGNGLPARQRREIIMSAVGQYRQAMRRFAGMTNLEVWYAHADIDQLRAQFDSQLQAQQRRRLDKGLARARTRDSLQEGQGGRGIGAQPVRRRQQVQKPRWTWWPWGAPPGSG